MHVSFLQLHKKIISAFSLTFLLFLPPSLALPEIVEFTAGPVNVINGDNVTLECYADGSPIQNVSWTFTNVSGITLFAISYLIDDTMARTGAISVMSYSPLYSEDVLLDTYSIDPPDVGNERLYGRLTITDISPDLAGTYNCTLVNIYDAESNHTTVNVQCKSYNIKQ